MASNARNVARALPPLNPGAMSPGGFGGVPATFGAQNLGGTSPLVSSYQQWTQGRPYGNNLPRDWQTFLSGSFGPLAPIQPVGIDSPDPQTGRPAPRRFTYPVAWNMPVGTPGDEGLKLVPFATLRALADTYSVARACINVRKQEILGLAWNIAPTREAEKKMGGGVSSARKDFEQRRSEAIAFFENPDPGKYRSFTTWLSAVLEDILVIDALSIYLQPTRLKGKGLLGSNLQSLRLIDGSTVRPLLDMMGGTPQPPNVAYQIFNFGIPRVDMTTAIAGADIADADPDDLEAEYRGDQLLYLPYEQRNWTPYGFACIEKALVPMLSGLQKQKYQLDYFSEGSIPGIFISSGDTTATPNQLRTWQDTLNAMAGDPAWKHKIMMLPGGSRIEPMRPVPLADQFDEVVMTQVCMAFDIMPMELGIAPKVSTTMSPGACYAEGTEVLTRAGWKRFEDVTIGLDGDQFATRNLKTHKFEWQNATAYQEYDFDGELIEFSSRDCKIRVTPNHRMLVSGQTGKVCYESIREAGGIDRKITVPATSEWTGDSPRSIRFGKYEWSSTDFAAFMGMWIAEGCLGRQYNKARRCVSKQIRITQNRDSKAFTEYTELLTRMLGRTPLYHEQSRSYLFNCAELWDYLNPLGHSDTKYIPVMMKNWSTVDLDAFLRFYLLGDGWLDGSRWRAKTVSKRLADDLQEIAQKLGMSASIVRREPRDTVIRGRKILAENCKPIYLVGFRSGITRSLTPDRVSYTGKVRCVSVPNTTLYIRDISASTAAWCGNSNQMAKASQSIHERKSLKPLLLWLKENVFDFVLQKVCGQEDMQFTWEGLEEGEDRESLIGNLINQVEHGLMSIDEARVELGEQPWGLPLTSDPVWATATGIVPVGAIDPATGRPMGEQLTLPTQAGVATQAPPAPSGQPGGAPAKPAPKPTSTPSKPSGGASRTPAKTPATTRPVTGTPAHATSGANTKPAQSTGRATVTPRKTTNKSAALREIDLYRRRLIKGRDATGWVFEFVPDDVIDVLKADLEPSVAINRARAMIKSSNRLQARDNIIADETSSLARSLAMLAQGIRQGTVSHMEFIDKGAALMRNGIRAGLFAGARLALSPESKVSKAEDDEYDDEQILDGAYGQYLAEVADNLGGEQGDFLQGLLQDLLTAGLVIDAFLSRFNLYGAQVRSAFEQGFGMTLFASDPDAWVIWHTTSAQPCALCAPRDGQMYSASTLPGWPGDGGFGGMSASGMGLCMGGPNCKCYLEAIQGDQSAIGINPMSDSDADFGRMNQMAQDIRAARQAFIASLPQSAQERETQRDAAASDIADALHSGDAEEGIEHPGMTQARHMMLGKKKKGKKNKKKSDEPKNSPPQLPPPLTNDGEATEITHEDHGDHHLPDETEHVFAYLARHYPLDVIEWVKSAVWRGPVAVDLSEIQFERRPGGARDEDKVRMMVTAIHDGTPPQSPVVLVQTPSSPPYRVADGYHRLAAFHDSGTKTVMAWIGKVSTETGPWGAQMNEAKLNH